MEKPHCSYSSPAQGEASDRTAVWPADLLVGTYGLQLSDASGSSEEVPFLVAPPTAFGGDFDRCWLLAVQLYGVKSSRNWGIGDLGRSPNQQLSQVANRFRIRL